MARKGNAGAHENQGSRVAVSLAFAQADCRRCGGRRLATRPCPDCQAPAVWHEVDARLQRRQRIATQVLNALIVEMRVGQRRGAAPMTINQVAQELEGWPTRFLRALNRAGSPSGEASELIDLVKDLGRVRRGVEGDVLRPEREPCRAALVTVGRLAAVAREWMNAFASPTPLEAEAYASQAQILLDQAIVPIADLVERAGRLEVISVTSSDDLLLALAALAATGAGPGDDGDSLLALDNMGTDEFRAITGSSSPSPGAGIGLHLMLQVVDVTMDRDRFISAAQASFQSFSGHPTRLAALVQTASWREAHSRANEQAFHLAVTSAAVQSAASSDRMAVEGLLSAVHKLVEGQARHLVATLLTVEKGSHYARLKRQDSSAVFKQAQQAGFERLLEGLDSPVRNAAAHMDFRVDDDSVVLNVDRGPTTVYTHAEVLDLSLAAQESVLALHAGLTCALETGSLNDSDLDLVIPALSPHVVLASILLLAGWTGVDIEHTAHESTITGDGALTPESLPLAAAAAAWLPLSTRRLVWKTVMDGRTAVLDVDIDALRGWHSRKGTLEEEGALLIAMSRSLFNGVPLAAPEMVDGWVAARVTEARESPYIEAVPQIRYLMRVTNELGRDDLEDLMRRVIAALRSTLN